MRLACGIATCVIGLSAGSAAAAQAGTVAVRSDVQGIRIASVDALPAPRQPQRFEEGDFCRNVQVEPETAAGRHAKTLGWHVTSEVEQFGYTAVGVYSRGSQATSGTCLVGDGNIVLYRRDRPVAIVYEPPHPENESGSVGGVVPTLIAGRLRISDLTPPGFVHADIELRPDAIVVSKVAALETACGQAGLPNVRGMDIPAARKALAGHGWKPADFSGQEGDSPYDSAGDRRKAGLTEFETCSGTGYGFCTVGYSHASGASLNVTTTGDDAIVSGYDVHCPGGGR